MAAPVLSLRITLTIVTAIMTTITPTTITIPTANAGAADRPATRPVQLAEIDPGIGDRLNARGHTVLHEVIHAAGVLRGHVLADFEAFDLAAEADGEGGNIETFDRGDAAAAIQNRIPRGGNGIAHRGDDPETRDDDSAAAHKRAGLLGSGARIIAHPAKGEDAQALARRSLTYSMAC